MRSSVSFTQSADVFLYTDLPCPVLNRSLDQFALHTGRRSSRVIFALRLTAVHRTPGRAGTTIGKLRLLKPHLCASLNNYKVLIATDSSFPNRRWSLWQIRRFLTLA
jgi:hypothetical protein